MAQKILLLFAHPAPHRSEVNIELFRAAKELSFVTPVDLYEVYPTFQIDIDHEQQQLIDHDVIVFQFPLYWYSTPAILKEWQDLVLEYGFAYGQHGNALHGKTFLCATTAGGARDAYQEGGLNNFDLHKLLRPLEQTAHLTGMRYLPPFALFGARTALEDGRIGRHAAAWQQLLTHLHNSTLDMERAMQEDLIGDDLSSIIVSPGSATTQPGAQP